MHILHEDYLFIADEAWVVVPITPATLDTSVFARPAKPVNVVFPCVQTYRLQ